MPEPGREFSAVTTACVRVPIQSRIESGGYMETGDELFMHGLNDMMDAERQLVEALNENAMILQDRN